MKSAPNIFSNGRQWFGDRPLGRLFALITVPAFVAALFIGNLQPWGPWVVAAMMAAWFLAAVASGLEEQKTLGKLPRPLTWRQRFRIQPVWTTIDALIIIALLLGLTALGVAYLLGIDTERWFDDHLIWFWIAFCIVQFAQILRPKLPRAAKDQA